MSKLLGIYGIYLLLLVISIFFNYFGMIDCSYMANIQYGLLVFGGIVAIIISLFYIRKWEANKDYKHYFSMGLILFYLLHLYFTLQFSLFVIEC
jgi:hypothetical protein